MRGVWTGIVKCEMSIKHVRDDDKEAAESRSFEFREEVQAVIIRPTEMVSREGVQMKRSLRNEILGHSSSKRLA